MDKRETFMKEIQQKGYDLRIPDENRFSERISTGVVALDYVMDGGITQGHKIELWGENQGGKSLLTQKIIAEFQKHDKLCVLIDAEGAYDPGWSRVLDVDPAKLLISEPDSLEEAGDMMLEMMQKGADLIVVDSIINLINEAELERDTSEPTRGGNAKVNSLIVKKLSNASRKYHTVFVFVNQVRIDMNKTFGNPKDTAGGKALKHFYDTRIQVIPAQTIKEGDEIIGKQVKLDCNKNRRGVPRRIGVFDFYHDGYINNNASIVNLAVKYGIIEKGGAWFTYKDIKAQGEVKFGEEINKADLWKELYDKVWEKINPKIQFINPKTVESQDKMIKEEENIVLDKEPEIKKKKGRPKKK